MSTRRLAKINRTMIAAYVTNIESVYARRTEADVREGSDWYPVTAYALAKSVGAGDVMRGAAILSATSQNCTWDQNVAMARRHGAGEHIGCLADVRAKLDAIDAGYTWREIFEAGMKLHNFCANIGGDLSLVTVDRWAIRIATGEDLSLPGGIARRAAYLEQYDCIAEAYRIVAARHGLAPAVLQAITWVTARREATR